MLATWIEQMTVEQQTITVNNKVAVSPEMWVYSKMAIGLRESIFTVTAVNEMWDSWKAERQLSWERIYNALTIEYNPIENTDRHETITDTTKHTGTEGTEEQGTLTKTGSDTLTKTGSSTNNTTLNSTVTSTQIATNKEAAFNNYTSPTVDNITDSTDTNKTSGGDTVKIENNLEDKNTHDTTDKNVVSATKTYNTTDTYTHSNHTHGNIGVTTNVQMLTEELAFRREHTLFNEFVKPFLDAVFF